MAKLRTPNTWELSSGRDQGLHDPVELDPRTRICREKRRLVYKVHLGHHAEQGARRLNTTIIFSLLMDGRAPGGQDRAATSRSVLN
jgi:hypothetical protein